MNDYDKNIKFEIYNSWEVIVMIDINRTKHSDDCILMEVLCDERKEYELLTLLIGYLNTYNVHRYQKKKMMELLFDD